MDELDAGLTIRGLVAGQRLFDRYTLLRIAGRGGMGVVWAAHDEKLDRNVALKFLPELVVHDVALLDQMKREARKSLELTHHHIVRIYDFKDDPPYACISMEYIDGPTLSALRVQKPNRVFEVDDIRNWIGQACQALDYAHRQARMVHRDLKPANLMLNSKGELKIADFGISRSLTDSVSLVTRSQGTSGTLVYMSPQQLNGERASHLDDIYSLGASVYDLLTGRPPFYSGQIDLQIRDKVPPTMTHRRGELEVDNPQLISPDWEQTVAASLSKDPGQRPQSAGEFAAQLGLERSGYKPPAVRREQEVMLERDNRNTANRRRLVVSLIGVLALLLGLTVMTWLLQMQRSKPRPTSLQTPEPRPAVSPQPPSVTLSLTPAVTSPRETPSAPRSEPSPTVEPTPSSDSSLVARDPIGAVRLYFDAVNRRDLTAAYELTSDEFHQRTTLDQYRKIFANTTRVNVSEISSTSLNGNSARVSVRFSEVDAGGQELEWSGSIDVTWGHGQWRIDRMKDLISRKSNATSAATNSPAEPKANQHLKKFTNSRYSYAALIPADVFPAAAEQSTGEHSIFVSPDGRTRLSFTVETTTPNRKLAELYKEWSAERTKEHPSRTVPYKVLKSNWFVVSGEEQGRGYYLKCVSRGNYLLSMLLEYDEDNCPLSQESFAAMARGFNGTLNP